VKRVTSPSHPNKSEETARLEIYKMLVEMADRVSQRRQAANNFYLSVNTAIASASAYLTTLHVAPIGIPVIALAGLCVSVLWVRNIQSYKELNEGKFHVITTLEKALPIQAFTDEWDYLHRGKRKKRYKPFHAVEVLVPWVFVAVHSCQLIAIVNWTFVVTSITSMRG
jgi:hypothetical protein